MPESKKYLQPEESVDWAERLRASMSEEDSENLSIDTTDDDLASLLRAQLAKGKDEMPTASSLDISEFEAESEEITEEIADEEDYADEPTEEIADVEDYTDEPTEEITDTEDYADELAEEIPDTEDYTDEPTEEIAGEGYSDEPTEEITDAEDYAAEDGTESLSAPASAPVVTDGLLNSDRLSASLTALDEENARLLEEEGVALLPEDGSLPDQISFFDEEGEVPPSVENEANDILLMRRTQRPPRYMITTIGWLACWTPPLRPSVPPERQMPRPMSKFFPMIPCSWGLGHMQHTRAPRTARVLIKTTYIAPRHLLRPHPKRRPSPALFLSAGLCIPSVCPVRATRQPRSGIRISTCALDTRKI